MLHPSSPSSRLPVAYFATAHLSLAGALLTLALRPETAGAFFFHPKMVALVHLLTVGWLTGSILGAFYIVAPLSLRLPLPVGRGDWWAWAAFTAGLSGVVSHAWLALYDGIAWSALLVAWPIVRLAARVARGLRGAVAPWPVLLHIGFAFANILGAMVYGAVVAWDRARGTLPYSPMLLAFAHAHLAAIGWVLMLIVGFAYRLVPMFIPSAMPTGWTMAISAVLLQAGVITLVAALPAGSEWAAVGAAVMVAGLASAMAHMAWSVRRRLPRPPALPAVDWSMWQTASTAVWLGVAAITGLWLAIAPASESTVPLMWVYGVAGLVGGLGQMVAGMAGRVIPLHAWYAAWAAHPGPPPQVAANALPSARWAFAVFVLWQVAVPLLAYGVMTHQPAITSAGAGLLCLGVCAGGGYLIWMWRRAMSPTAEVSG